VVGPIELYIDEQKTVKISASRATVMNRRQIVKK
jgi:hypothetical protein